MEQPVYSHVLPLDGDLVAKSRVLKAEPAVAASIPLPSGPSGASGPSGHALPCDVFTNETIIGCVMAELHDQRQLRSVVPLRAAWPCHAKRNQTKAYLAFDRFDRGELSRLPEAADPDTLLSLVAQVLLTLDHLQRDYDFTSGDCKASNVLVRSWQEGEGRRARFILPGEENERLTVSLHSPPLVAALADFDAAAITYPPASKGQGVRFRYFSYRTLPLGWLPRRIRPEIRLYRRKFKPTPIEVIEDRDTGQVVECYRMGWSGMHRSAYLTLRHAPCPPPPSFDLYTLLVSLALEDTIAPSFGPCGTLRTLWEGLWLAQELEQADQLVERTRRQLASNAESRRGIGVPMDILAGLAIKRDAMAMARCRVLDLLVDSGLASVQRDLLTEESSP